MRRHFSRKDAVADEALPGSKAGNEMLDDFYAIASELQDIAKLGAKAIDKDISLIIKQHATDNSLIENTLDTLLQLMLHGQGEQQFKKLLEYYKGINKEGYGFYKEEYDKFLDYGQ